MKMKEMNKNYFLSVIIVSIFIWTVYSVFNSKESDISLESNFIENCVNSFANKSVSADKKRDFCRCSHDFLYAKYDSILYDSGFEISDTEDSTEIANCFSSFVQNTP